MRKWSFFARCFNRRGKGNTHKFADVFLFVTSTEVGRTDVPLRFAFRIPHVVSCVTDRHGMLADVFGALKFSCGVLFYRVFGFLHDWLWDVSRKALSEKNSTRSLVMHTELSCNAEMAGVVRYRELKV